MRRPLLLLLVLALGLTGLTAIYILTRPGTDGVNNGASSVVPNTPVGAPFLNNETFQTQDLSTPTVSSARLGDEVTESPTTLAPTWPPSPAVQFEFFGAVSLQPDFEVDGQGENVDSIAFWEAPDPAKTLMFVTSKENQLVEIWKYPFRDQEQPPIQGVFGSGKVNGIVMDQETDLLFVTQAEESSTVYVFSISAQEPYWELKGTFYGIDLGSEPNQDILYHASGETWLYVTDSRKGVYTWNVDPISRGAPPESRGTFTASDLTSIETVLADDYYQVIYLPDENGRTGVYAYQTDGARYERNNRDQFGAEEIFQSDEEGILLYPCLSAADDDTGRGLIVVADQKKDQTDFEFFDRLTWEHLGKLEIEGVSNTDGIASIQKPLPDYPLGIFAAINDDKTTVGVGWDKIFAATGLSCDKP